jgi:hypothetical protein
LGLLHRAFLSPRIIPAIVDGAAPADLTVTSLAKALPYGQRPRAVLSDLGRAK